ncbi:MAG: DNA cytosine methyltransferase [Bacteroidales bacterium]|nr:DNA cytosine methyltransferase [Bacteroidales bacterium]
MDKLTLGSLFDGSGGFLLGGLLAGITPVWASEIEPFPIRVTTKRMPFIKHYGDVSAMNGGKIEPVDIITFGSPCQDMSVAGKRSGLDGERSSLFYEAVRIIKEMRCATNGKYPRYAVWENVPGAFSSNGGEDFKAVLEALLSVKSETVSVSRPERWPSAGEILGDGCSLAWRVLDTQYWGVPQRRKRIYLVADFAGGSAGKILFESEGVSGYSAEGFRAWQRAAGGAAAGAGEPGGDGVLAFHINQREETIDLHGVSGALMATRNMQMQTFVASPVPCLNDQGGERMDVTEDVTSTLRAEAHHPPCVVESAGFCTEHSANSRSIGYEAEKSPTLRAGVVPAAVPMWENHSQDTRYTGPLDTAPTVSSTYGTGGNNQPFVVGGTPKELKIRSGCEGGGKGALMQEDKSATLGCNNDQTVFVPQAYGISSFKSNAMLSDNPHAGIYEAETSRTLDIGGGSPTCNQGGIVVVESYSIQGNNQGQNAKFSPSIEEELQPTLVTKGPDTVQSGYTVRRLTPTECARLQGFPDWWCADLGTEKPTDEELYFWYKMFETHRLVTNPKVKPKTSKQIAKWLKDPHSDSAEYKMWGNGVALPCVAFVLSGIVLYYSQLPAE